MDNLSIDAEDLNKALVDLTSKEGIIAALKDKYQNLSFALPEKYEEGHEAIKELKKVRVEIEKRRVELKKPVLDIGRKIDSVAQQLISTVEEIEEPLIKAKQLVDDAARKKLEEEKARLAKIELDRLAAEEAERKRLEREEKEKEEKRLKAARERLKADQEKLAEERRKVEVQQEQERAKLADERKAFEAEKQKEKDKLKAIEDEKKRLEQVEKDRLATIEAARLAKEKLVQDEQKRKEDALREAGKREAIKPDAQSALLYADKIRVLALTTGCVTVTCTGQEVLKVTREELMVVANKLETWANGIINHKG